MLETELLPRKSAANFLNFYLENSVLCVWELSSFHLFKPGSKSGFGSGSGSAEAKSCGSCGSVPQYCVADLCSLCLGSGVAVLGSVIVSRIRPFSHLRKVTFLTMSQICKDN
jgi:hypothetical protein